ncbi:MAG: hypothetical protein ABI778_08835 [Ignavibacteriota bacterium]
MQSNLQNITFPVEAEAALAYQSAPIEEQRKLQRLFSYLLKQRLGDEDIPTIKEMMERMGTYAAENGLTEEKLKELLAND